MLDYKSSAEQILDLVGGKTNITQFAHCSTRLRFTLKDNSKANLDALKKVPGVMGVVLKGQLQVIIGNNVVEMYEALQKAGQLEGAGIVPDDDAPAPKKKVSDLVLDFLIGTFQPLIGVKGDRRFCNACAIRRRKAYQKQYRENRKKGR